MFVELLISMFGIVIVHRNLSLLEKVEVISDIRFRFFFILLQFPLLLHLIFKELTYLVIIYIGIFIIILILSPKIISKIYQNSFEKLHINIIQRVLLQVSSGQSCKTSLSNVWNQLSRKEKATFAPINDLIESRIEKVNIKSSDQKYFYDELVQILTSDSHVLMQLRSLRRILLLQYNLRHKSRQSTLQIRAQALICILIYVFILCLSYFFLKLELFSWLTFVSLLLQVMGLYFIFGAGKQIKWKT